MQLSFCKFIGIFTLGFKLGKYKWANVNEFKVYLFKFCVTMNTSTACSQFVYQKIKTQSNMNKK